MITFGFKNRFSGWTRAAIAILVGCFMLVRPGSAIDILVYVLASILVASGIVSLVYGFANRKAGGLGLQLFNTVVDILIGALIFAFPQVVTNIIMWVIGAALVVFGMFQIIVMISAAPYLRMTAWTFILPSVCAVGGVVLLFNASDVTVAIIRIAGAAILVYGVSEIFSTWKMKKAVHEYEIKFPSSGPSGTAGTSGYADVKDAEFEKVSKDEE